MIQINTIFKKIFVIIILVILAIAFSSSYRSSNIDHLAFVVALGIDTSDTQNMKVTFEFTNSSSKSEKGSSEEAKTTLNTVETSSLFNAISIMNAYVEKKINLSHCKIIVFSEDFAQNGISDEIYSLMNNIQVRPSANIIVSKCDAKYYIENSEPNLENLVTNYYDTFPTSSEYTGCTVDATIGKFFNNLTSNDCDPYAILGGLTSSDSSSSISASSISSNDMPISGKRKSESIGVAVFKDDKLVGELNSIETISFLNINNEAKSFLVSIPDPNNSDAYLDLFITPDKKPKINIKISNGTPFISITCNLNAKIYSMSPNSSYLSADTLSSISTACNNYLNVCFSSYLYKTSVDFNSDISGLGKYSFYNFSTSKKFEEFNWLNNYKNSVFNVNVITNIDSGALLTHT